MGQDDFESHLHDTLGPAQTVSPMGDIALRALQRSKISGWILTAKTVRDLGREGGPAP